MFRIKSKIAKGATRTEQPVIIVGEIFHDIPRNARNFTRKGNYQESKKKHLKSFRETEKYFQCFTELEIETLIRT